MKFFAPWKSSYKPVYGGYVNVVHPYDFYDVLAASEDKPVHVGNTGIPVSLNDGRYYLSNSEIVRLKDKIYVVTTTVKPSPTASLK